MCIDNPQDRIQEDNQPANLDGLEYNIDEIEINLNGEEGLQKLEVTLTGVSIKYSVEDGGVYIDDIWLYDCPAEGVLLPDVIEKLKSQIAEDLRDELLKPWLDQDQSYV